MKESAQIVAGDVLVTTEILGKDEKVMIVKVSVGDKNLDPKWQVSQYLLVKVKDAAVTLIDVP